MNEQANHKFVQKLIDAWKQLESRYLDAGQMLGMCRDERKFEPMYSSFREFCKEINITEETATRYIQIYKELHIEAGIPKKILAKVGWSSLADILGVAGNKTSARKWVNTAIKVGTRADLRKEIAEHKTGIPMSKCPHKDTYSVTFCRKCKDSWKTK